MKAEIPKNETERLAALKSLNILGSAPEEVFDNITCLAANVCNTPISLITLIDSDKQWFKSKVGLSFDEMSRDSAFCAHAILNPDEIMIVSDTHQDNRFVDNPIVTSNPGIRFYAGIPISTKDGFPLGTLCVLDDKPRVLTEDQIEALKALHKEIEIQIELRRNIETFKLVLNEEKRTKQDILNASKELEGKIKKSAGKLSEISIKLREELEERKKIEKELIAAKEKAEQSERLKSEFLAQITHEIRSPLNVIFNHLSLIKMELEENISPDLEERFDSIENGSSRIIRTVDLVLNYSEVQKGFYKPNFKEHHIIKDILNPLINEYKALAEKKNLKLDLVNEVQNPLLNVDQYSATQIFANLISNAIKFTNHGKITVKTSTNKKGNLCVCVQDTGIGIDEKYMKILFLPFTQEEQGYTRTYEGNGLGLALVKKYCEINNAAIKVKSEKEKGSRFSLEFKNHQ